MMMLSTFTLFYKMLPINKCLLTTDNIAYLIRFRFLKMINHYL